jgi:hypothetical protein
MSATLFMSAQGFAQDDYEADPTKLVTKAKRSSELYVEPAFNFDSHRVYTLDFSVSTAQGEPLSGVFVRVSSLPMGVEQVDDEALLEKALMTSLMTDQYGRAYQQIEVTKLQTNLLIELNMQIEGNQVIFDASQVDTVSYHFTVE